MLCCNRLINPCTPCSKKTKIQSRNLGSAILEGLMPITTEDEGDDGDDDSPARVSVKITIIYELSI